MFACLGSRASQPVMQRPVSIDGHYSPPNFRFSLHWLILAFLGIIVHQTYSLRSENATYLQSSTNASLVKEEYVVFSGNTTQQSQQLIASLRFILDSGDIAEYGGIYTGPQFWLVQMDSTQTSRLLKSIPGVSIARICQEQPSSCPKKCLPYALLSKSGLLTNRQGRSL